MKKIDELKKELVHGDYQIIHKMTNVPVGTITAIFTNNRKAETPQGEKIRKAAHKLIESRRALLDTEQPEEPELDFSHTTQAVA
jgi:hypothetical protein